MRVSVRVTVDDDDPTANELVLEEGATPEDRYRFARALVMLVAGLSVHLTQEVRPARHPRDRETARILGTLTLAGRSLAPLPDEEASP